MNNAKLHIGTSGWSYIDWKSGFYPAHLKQAEYLNFYSNRFATVEVDSSFYAIPRMTTVENWYAQTPANFIFSPKAPQIVTHSKRLTEAWPEWETFIRTMGVLKEKLGPIVLQFDYRFTFKEHFEQLEIFLSEQPYEGRLCVEIRNKDWHRPEFYEMLRKHKVALVLNDLYYMPRVIELTADFTYIRLLGNRKQIPSDFSHVRIPRDKDISWWTEKINRFLKKELEVFVYSNNRYQGHAPATSGALVDKFNY